MSLATLSKMSLRGWPQVSRILSIIMGIILVGTLTASFTRGPVFYEDITPIFAAFSLIPAGLAIIWSSIALALLLLLKPYHPGVDVGLDLFTCLAHWALGGLMIASLASSWGTGDCLNTSDTDYSRYCEESGAYRARLDCASTAFLIANGLNHFVYFVIACRRTDLRRRFGPNRDLADVKSEHQYAKSGSV